MPQLVYFLGEVDFTGNPTGYYKLGLTTRETEVRKNEYKAGNPRELRTLYTVTVQNAQTSETYLHQRFDKQRLKGYKGGDEWFAFSPLEIDTVIFEMDSQGQSAMRPVYITQTSHKAQFAYDMGVGAWATLCWLFRAALWTFKPISKHKYSDNFATRAFKYPICWIMIAFVLLNMFNSTKSTAKTSTVGKKAPSAYVQK